VRILGRTGLVRVELDEWRAVALALARIGFNVKRNAQQPGRPPYEIWTGDGRRNVGQLSADGD